ncbi:helix-turn-helix domain-containing protein [Streptomyces sp. NPDC059631]|uniref:helix-turn-helix domain-containing protein n=1 Tax=unclassified Streptomyces TaxID=2593676 RepID=UPI00367B1304
MATANPTGTSARAERNARVHQLAAEGHSHRAIARQTGVHHTTVARILRTTTPPNAPAEHTAPEQAERTTTAPPAPTSDDRPAPPRTILLKPIAPALTRDLNVLLDRRTGALPAPLDRIVRAYADRERARWSAALTHHSTDEEFTR